VTLVSTKVRGLYRLRRRISFSHTEETSVPPPPKRRLCGGSMNFFHIEPQGTHFWKLPGDQNLSCSSNLPHPGWMRCLYCPPGQTRGRPQPGERGTQGGCRASRSGVSGALYDLICGHRVSPKNHFTEPEDIPVYTSSSQVCRHSQGGDVSPKRPWRYRAGSHG